MRLTRRVLALTGGQHLPKDGFLDLGLVHTGAGDHAFNHGCTQIVGGCVGERSIEAADGGAPCGNDNNIGHLVPLPGQGRGGGYPPG